MDTPKATSSGEGPLHVRARKRRWNVKRRRLVAARWNVKRGKVSAGDHHIPDHYASSEAGRQKLISSPPLMQFMKYVVPAVLLVVTLKYQGKPETLFQENPVPLWCFFAATWVYWLIVGVIKQMTTVDGKYFQALIHAALASGILSATSLVSIFLPYPVSVVTILISLPVALALRYACSLFHRGIISVINKIHAVVVWAKGLINTTEEASLPL